MTRMAEVRRELDCSYCVFVPDDEWDEFFDDLITSEPDLFFHNVARTQKITETPRADINQYKGCAKIGRTLGAFVYLLLGGELLCASCNAIGFQLIDLNRVWYQEPDSMCETIDETALLSMI